MNEDTEAERHSRAAGPELISDPISKAEAEARNGLKQYDLALSCIQAALDRRDFSLRPSLILGLHRTALEGLSLYAGNFRPAGVVIEGSVHRPPESFLVPELVEDMCDYVNERWPDATPIHLAAYIMWRLNWIHPFADGNGRTSRMLSYVVLSVRAGFVLPGTPTIPDQIVENRGPYFAALDAADAAFRANGETDVTLMEELLGNMLARQLTSFYALAVGKSAEG